MSLYIVRIEVPSQTRPRQAVSEILQVRERVVDACAVTFEDGCFNGVGVALFNRSRQFSPFGARTWIRGNDTTIAFNLEFRLEASPYEIEIKCYNLARDYAHEVEVRIEVVDETLQMSTAALAEAFGEYTNRNRKKR